MTRTALARRIERERQAIETDNRRITTLKTETLARLEQDGIGMTPEIAAGLERDTIQAVVAIGDYAAGYLAVENAINIAQGKTVESVTFPYFLVHKEDLNDTEMQKLLFPVDE